MQAYDQHLNMILGEVEETITTVEIDDETYEEIIKVRDLFFQPICALQTDQSYVGMGMSQSQWMVISSL